MCHNLIVDWLVLLAIIAVVLAIVTTVQGFKLAKRKKPVWAYRTTKVIGSDGEAPPEVKLTFNAQPVTDVYRTRVILFNKGNEPFKSEDVTESIVIHFMGADILQQPTILASSKEAIKASAQKVGKNGDNGVEFSFKYLDHNDGILIEVLHTKSQNMKCSGNIIGTNKIDCVGEFVPSATENLGSRPVLALVLVCVGAGILFAGLKVATALKSIGGFEKSATIIYLLLGINFGMICALVASEARRLLRYRKFPKWSRLKE